MNGKERMLTALSLGIPDRVPHWELAYNESSIINIARQFTSDVPEIDYIQRMDLDSKIKLFDTAVRVIEEIDVDGITMRVFSESEFFNDTDYKDNQGVVYRVDPVGESVVIGGPISQESDLETYKLPKIKETDLLALSYCVEKLGENRAIVLSLQCPFRRSWNLVGGMTHLLLHYMDHPQFVHKIARMVTDSTLEAIDMGLDLGADIISLDGDLAFNTNTIMSPEQFREYIKPYYIEIVNYVHNKGHKIFKHTDGNHSIITEDLVEIGFDGLHPIQPQCLDIGHMKKEIGQRICLMGNIDCMETLVSKSLAEVEEEVKQTIEIAAPGGGYILASSNTIHPGVKAENYIAMVKAAHKYGVYNS